MLNDRERRGLADLEAVLRNDDPQLARRLTVGPTPTRRRAAAGAAFIAALALAIWLGMLAAGAAAAIGAALMVCAIATGLLLQRRAGARMDLPPDA